MHSKLRVTLRRTLIAAGLLVAVVAVAVLWPFWRDTSDANAPAASSETKPATSRLPRWATPQGIAGKRIAGIVVGDDGAPVSGASVRIASAFTMAGVLAEPSIVTDEAGRFDFHEQPVTEYIVVAEQSQRTGALVRVDLRDVTATPDQLRLVLYPCDASIHGTIRDVAGGVIKGAVIARADGSLAVSGGTISDDRGAYELCVPVGVASVVVRADGYATVSDGLQIYGRMPRDYALSPGASVVGRVVRASDHAPVADAIVEDVTDGDRYPTPIPAATTSDADGRFHLGGLAPGHHAIVARAERLVTADPVDAMAEVGKPSEEVVCELVPAVSITGVAIERGTRKPAAGERLSIGARAALGSFMLDGVSVPEASWPSTITQADGAFRFDHVRPGEYVLLSARGDAAPPVTVATTDITGVVLEIDPGATISGRIRAHGKPVDGARVIADIIETVTDIDGRYMMHGVRPGTHWIGSDSWRLGAFSRGRSVTVARGDHLTDVDLELDLAGSISGIVVDQNGAPVAGALLKFSLLHGRDFGSTTTAVDGSFTVRSLSGGGDYVYEVRRAENVEPVFPPLAGKRVRPIALHDGTTNVTGVRIEVRVERLSLAGRVLDATDQGIADAAIRVTPERSSFRTTATTTTDGSGAFAIADLAPGVYVVEATTANGSARSDAVSAGRTDLALRLVALGGIDGILERFAGPVAVSVYHVDERRYATVTGNTFQLRNLVPGAYSVSASNDGAATFADVTVSAGAMAKVTLRHVETGAIEGTVVDDASRPVADMQCTAQASTTRSPPAQTNASGSFRIEHAAAGSSLVRCYGGSGSAYAEVEVVAGATARVALAIRPDPPRARIGLRLEKQLDDLMVMSVELGGPAARAGVVVGDILRKINDRVLTRHDYEGVLREVLTLRPVTIVLERGDQELTVIVTPEPMP